MAESEWYCNIVIYPKGSKPIKLYYNEADKKSYSWIGRKRGFNPKFVEDKNQASLITRGQKLTLKKEAIKFAEKTYPNAVCYVQFSKFLEYF